MSIYRKYFTNVEVTVTSVVSNISVFDVTAPENPEMVYFARLQIIMIQVSNRINK